MGAGEAFFGFIAILAIPAFFYSAIGILWPRLPLVRSRKRAELMMLTTFVAFIVAASIGMSLESPEARQAREARRAEEKRAEQTQPTRKADVEKQPQQPQPDSIEYKLATVATSTGPLAKLLRSHFPSTIPIHGTNYRIGELPCVDKDLAVFTTTAGASTGRFKVSGTTQLAAVPTPFRVINGAQGQRYMLHLQAYLFTPSGKMVWTQQGFPEGGAWVSGSGSTTNFLLIGAYSGPTQGYQVIVLAAGDPIFSTGDETRVVLGAKQFVLP